MKVLNINRIFIFVFSLTALIALSCGTSEVYIPKPGKNSTVKITPAEASRFNGDYTLSTWKQVTEEDFTIIHKQEFSTEFIEIIQDVLGLERYDNTILLGSGFEIKGFIPAGAILEFQKQKEEFDPFATQNIFTKDWKLAFTLTYPEKIVHYACFNSNGSNSINIFATSESGKIFKDVISNATKFLDIENSGVAEFEASEPLEITQLEGDKINGIIALKNFQRLFLALFSGQIVEINYDSMQIVQRYKSGLWNCYSINTVIFADKELIAVAGRHPKYQLILYNFNNSKGLEQKQAVEIPGGTSVTSCFAKSIPPNNIIADSTAIPEDSLTNKRSGFIVFSTANHIMIYHERENAPYLLNKRLGTKIIDFDVSPGMNWAYITTDSGSYMFGLNKKNKLTAMTSSKIVYSDIFGENADKTNTKGKFINDRYFLIANSDKAKLLRTTSDKSIIGEPRVIEGKAVVKVPPTMPSYSNIESYEKLLNKIEDACDWKALRDVYKYIDSKFNPNGTHFPGYSGVAMRGGWIADTVSDNLNDRELISALIIKQSQKNQENLSLLLCEDKNGKSPSQLVVGSIQSPKYLKHVQPLLCMHRSAILSLIDPDEILSKFKDYIRLWDECLVNVAEEFSKHSIDEETIDSLVNTIFEFGLEVFHLLPAPLNKRHSELEKLLKQTSIFTNNVNFVERLNKANAEFKQKWISGRE